MKRYIKHIVIAVCFIALLLIGNFIFSNVVKVENESTPQKLTLPANSNAVELAVDNAKIAKVKWKSLIQIDGWAFTKGQNAKDNTIYLVLKSRENTYVFNTTKHLRGDISQKYGQKGLSLENSGFTALIGKGKIKDGVYNVGIYIENKSANNKSLTFSDMYITKERGSVKKGFVSEALSVKLPAESNNITSTLDMAQKTTDGENELLQLTGWAFVAGRPTADNDTAIVLKSQSQTYIFSTVSKERTDVTKQFGKGVNLNESGFNVFIPKNSIADGSYQIGFYIKNKGQSYYALSENYVTKEKESFYRGIVSAQQQIQLPEASANVTFNTETVRKLPVQEKAIAELKGWAFMQGQPTDNMDIYLVLKSNDQTYIYNTLRNKRPDVTQALGKGTNLDNSGFQCFVPVDAITDGVYQLGIYIKSGNAAAFTLGDKYVTKKGTELFKGVISNQQQISVPAAATKVMANVEYLQKEEQPGVPAYYEIKGWGFVQGQNATNNTIYVVLKSAGTTYVFDAIMYNRPDVTQALGAKANLNLDNSGFHAFIPKDKLQKGEYTVGVYIKTAAGGFTGYSKKTLVVE